MKLKSGVNLYGLHPMMQIANAKAAVIWNKHGQELVVTSATDSKHGNGSFHYKARACDYRTRYFSDHIKEKVAAELAEELGPDYDVVLEKTHIHCEFDPKDAKKV